MQPWRLVKGEVADVCDLAGFSAFNQPGFVLAVVSFELEQTEKPDLTALAGSRNSDDARSREKQQSISALVKS